MVEVVMKSKTNLGKSRFAEQKLVKTKGRREALAAERRTVDLAGQSRRNNLLPDLQISMVPISELTSSPHHARRRTPEQLERVIASIADLGFCKPILIADNQVIDGVTRVSAAKQLGLTQVPAIDCGHLSKTDRRKLALAINRTAETGEWDLDLLRIEFTELLDLDVDLGSTGFTLQEQDIIMLDNGSDEEEEPLDELPAVPVTQLGDVWELDDHRVICGSALEPSVYEKLLLGVLVAIIIADFPYNVCIGNNVSGLGKKKHAEFKMASGEMSDAEFAAFLEATITCAVAHLVAGGVLYGFMDWRSIDKLYRAGSAAKLTLLNLVVWYKQSGAMGAFYRSAHELIAVLCKGDKPRTNNIGLGKNGRDRCNVWSMPGANRPGSSAHEMLGEHATPKPVELCVDAILDVTLPDEAVLDPFLGSGTTLIAAEKTGRHCYGIELEPGFVDVTILRWQRLTGKQAVLAGTDQTFDALAQSRRAPDPAS